MAGVKITVDISGDNEIKRYLERLERAGKNMKPLFDEIGAYLDSETALRFKESVDPFGKQWKISNRARDEAGKTLVDHGHLRDSYTHIATEKSVIHGSNKVYAAIHQFGGKTGRGHKTSLVARPVLGLNATDKTEILSMTKSFLEKQVYGYE